MSKGKRIAYKVFILAGVWSIMLFRVFAPYTNLAPYLKNEPLSIPFTIICLLFLFTVLVIKIPNNVSKNGG